MTGPGKIMLIRHAEKPVSASPGGIDESGAPDPHSLTVRGWQRAGALVAFFGVPARNGILKPETIVASAPSLSNKDVERSRRPGQTVAPLHARIGGKFLNDVPVGSEDILTQRLLRCEGTVLVAWEHKRLHHIVAAFVDFLAPEWDDDRYDEVWILDRLSEAKYRLSTVNQDLLAGDRPA